MDSRLLGYYDTELSHLRKVSSEFAREFPKIAGRLMLDENQCADPYVERLLEGFAYLSARVRLKLDAEFPRFTQSILGTVYPYYFAPTPSMAIVRFEADPTEGSLAEGFSIPRNTQLRSLLGRGEHTACEYRTAHDVTLWPIRVVEAQYHTRDLGTWEVPPRIGARAAIRLRLECTMGAFNELPLDELTMHLVGSGALPMRLYEQLHGRCAGVLIQPARRPVRWQEFVPASREPVGRVGFEDHEALLPTDARTFQGYRLLREYFVFPQRFMFVRLAGLQAGLRRCEERQLDVLVLLNEADPTLENAVEPDNFQLFCTPAVNLFSRRCDPINLSDRFSEFQVITDRTRPLDFEIYQVQRVVGYGVRSDDEQEFYPFYAASDFDTEQGAYFVANRVPRMLSQKERRGVRRSEYSGSEVYLSLVDSHNAPYRSDLKQLSVASLCTNRDLPIGIAVGTGRTDFDWEIGAPLTAVRCVGRPTLPRPAFTEGEMAWRAISHLTLNYLTLVDNDEHEGAAALRDLLGLYGDIADLDIRRQIDGLRSARCEPIVQRVPTPGPIAFARGLCVEVLFDEQAFEGSGPFLLGAVLERFFAKYVSINSFTQTVVRTTRRGEIMRWPMRVGQRTLL